MKKKIIYMTACLALATGFTSCSLDEYNPSAGEATLENYTTWKALQAQCYSTLYNELYSKSDFLIFSEGGTDLWMNPSGTSYADEIFNYNGLGVARNEVKKVWQQAYSVIATCNTVINRAPDTDEAKVLVAEAKCIRAFMHLTLTTYYGPITIVTTEVGSVDTRPQRNSLQEVYASITKDLQEAANDLKVQPLEGNTARVSKKAALGLLARAYAQGAGEGLTENGVSYWQRAKEVAEDVITNASNYNVYLYPDVNDLWAWENNRNNKENLFTAAGLDAKGPNASMAGTYFNATSNNYAFTSSSPYSAASDLYKVQKASDLFLGPHQQTCIFAPTKHAIDVYGDWDKRYENTYMTAYGQYSIEGNAAYTNLRRGVRLTAAICTKYGIDKDKHLNDTIHTYAQISSVDRPGGTQNYVSGIYKKGDMNTIVKDVKNPFVIAQPLDYDEDRISIWISKNDLSAEERAKYRMAVINLSSLFDSNGNYTSEKISFGGANTNLTSITPSLIKYNWAFDGVTRHLSTDSYDYRNGDVPIMRTAELYLIAAEAELALGNASGAAKYIQPLWNRASRTGVAPTVSGVDEQFILDEYAREFAGEHMRWAVLKRHKALKSSLDAYNKKAASYFKDVNIWRPISQTFLDQIENANEYGDNGYDYNGVKGY